MSNFYQLDILVDSVENFHKLARQDRVKSPVIFSPNMSSLSTYTLTLFFITVTLLFFFFSFYNYFTFLLA